MEIQCFSGPASQPANQKPVLIPFCAENHKKYEIYLIFWDFFGFYKILLDFIEIPPCWFPFFSKRSLTQIVWVQPQILLIFGFAPSVLSRISKKWPSGFVDNHPFEEDSISITVKYIGFNHRFNHQMVIEPVQSPVSITPFPFWSRFPEKQSWQCFWCSSSSCFRQRSPLPLYISDSSVLILI